VASRRGLLGQGTRRAKKRAQEQCVGKNPTDRSKAGVKKSLLVEGSGRPLAVCIAGANGNEMSLLKSTLDAIVVERPAPADDAPQHLCLDKGYDNQTGEQATLEADYVPHIRRIGEEKNDDSGEKTHPARRWVVERTLDWLSRLRGLLVRYDKLAECYLAMVKLGCALLWFRRLHDLTQEARLLTEILKAFEFSVVVL